MSCSCTIGLGQQRLCILNRTGCHHQWNGGDEAFTKPTQSGLGTPDYQRAFATHRRGLQDLSSALKQQCAGHSPLLRNNPPTSHTMHMYTRTLFLPLINQCMKKKSGQGVPEEHIYNLTWAKMIMFKSQSPNLIDECGEEANACIYSAPA